MNEDTRRLAVRGAVVLVMVIAAAIFARWLLRTDWQRISDAVDDARDALVEERDEDFLGFFTDDLVYLETKDRAALERDLARWHGMGLASVYVQSREIELDGDEAQVTLTVFAGKSLILMKMGQVDVVLDAVKDADGAWRVRSFAWKRK